MCRLFAMLCVILLMPGCGEKDKHMTKALKLRETVIAADHTSFQAEILADYGQEVCKFKVDCVGDREGNLQFTVLEPESISDITGEVHAEVGRLTYDGAILGFPVVAGDTVSPVSAPWIFLSALRSGYIVACGETDTGMRLTVNDSYAEDALKLDIWVDGEATPTFAEIYWQNRRVLSLTIENFKLV